MATKTKIPMCIDDKQDNGCVKYKRRAKNMSSDDISFSTYDLEKFACSDINSTMIDDGANY
ncbi:hypothetical protein BGZ95_000732 [Linnemannia exigua]|uniref:Uncharacterized protein n=1 Tax=Linnemannia exigua TaxID=604196 RepID=A0AAD4H4J7_9FUNG|nr:hypothetical protein BGZ95_000732 [Linnemannia exigua]